MKKKYLLFVSSLFLLIGCNNSKINIPESPFKEDKYQRTGIKSNYEISNSLNDTEYKKLSDAVTTTEGKTDEYVTKYSVQDETRDLKYAYFGKEISEMFFNSLSSKNSEATKYKNNVTIESTKLNQTIQMASGENNIFSDSNVFAFDTNYKGELSKKYASYLQTIKYKDRLRKELDSNKTTVTTEPTDYSEAKDVFNLKPLKIILDSYFKTSEEYKFKLLGDNALYGKTKDNEYVIKEAYSIFNSSFTTALGKKYLSLDNYFYDALLIDPKKDDNLCFKEFRFYHETLILTEAIKGNDVPILYLEKPVLIWFNEVTYKFSYDNIDNYTGDIPEPTKTK